MYFRNTGVRCRSRSDASAAADQLGPHQQPSRPTFSSQPFERSNNSSSSSRRNGSSCHLVRLATFSSQHARPFDDAESTRLGALSAPTRRGLLALVPPFMGVIDTKWPWEFNRHLTPCRLFSPLQCSAAAAARGAVSIAAVTQWNSYQVTNALRWFT